MIKNKVKNHLQKRFIALILILAGIRVFIFNAAFPICNNVDESAHLDMVYKYSTCHIPKKGLENYDSKSLELIILYSTPEYMTYAPLNESMSTPHGKLPGIKQTKEFHDILNSYSRQINHETGSFPVYYLWAGMWWKFAELIGLSEVNLIYLIRFLNVPVFIAMVWIAFLTGKTIFPDNNFMQKGLPIMVAAFPQDMFYSISNDTISPLLFSLSLLMLMKILFEDKPLGFYFAAAVVIALAFLNKVSNITMLALLGPVILLKLRQITTEKKTKENIFRMFILLTVSVIPLCFWLIRNYIVLGDITGTTIKNAYLGWTPKSFGQIWHHPIFSLSGISFFLGKLTKTFWRGEFMWHLKTIASKIFDSLYIISTGIFLLVSFVSLFRNRDVKERIILQISFILIAASVAMLAVLSTLYDFGKCWNPSREHPYFTSGRLIVTTLMPFLIIYLYGLEKVLAMLKNRFNPLIFVVLLAAAITISEIILTWQIFASPYNWFHLML